MKPLYPENWLEIRELILERAKGRCEFCGVDNHWIIYRDRRGKVCSVPRSQRHLKYCYDRDGVRHKNVKIVLTVAHLNHNPADNRPENLAALCQRCHNRHDVSTRVRNRKARLHKARATGELL
ncbi:MAG: hypothetical protein C4570_02105 [Ammonifex sp.]|nr:MAG: hypothetical protein C4570_02105 [Ammonifex sp.]